jgi:hypothetical protein
MLYYHFSIFCLILALQSPLSTLAQVSPYKNYTVADGLLSNKVFAICQDSTRYMYFATDRGISVFNGHSFKNFTVKEGMPTNIYYGLYKDKWNRVWAQSTSDQLIAFKDGEIEKKYLLNKVCRQIIIYESSSGISFMDNNLDLYSENKSSNKIITVNLNEKFKTILPDYAIYPTGEDNIALFKQDVILNYNIEKKIFDTLIHKTPWLKYFYENKEEQPSIFRINQTLILYFHTNKRVIGFNINKINEIIDINLSNFYPKNTLFYSPSLMNKVFKLESSLGMLTINAELKYEHIKYPINKLQKEYTRSYIDDLNNLWLGTISNGVILFTKNENRVKTIEYNQGNDIFQLINSKDTNIIITTSQGKVFTIKKQNLIEIYNCGGKSITSIDIFHNSASIICGGKLLNLNFYLNNYPKNKNSEIDTNNIYTYFSSIKPMLSSDLKNSVRENNTTYISTLLDLISVEISNSKINFKKITDGIIEKMQLDHNNNLFYIKDKKLHLYNKLKYPSSKIIFRKNGSAPTCFSIDKKKNIWIGTNTNELWVINSDNLEELIYKFEHPINDLIADSCIYVSTSNGIYLLNYNFNTCNISMSRLSRQDGLINNNIIGLSIDDKNIYAIGDEFLSIIQKNQIKRDFVQSPKITIRNINYPKNNKSITLNSNISNLNLVLESFDYQSLGESKFHYMLDGFDEEWKITKNTEINYALTKPGTYTFRCKLENYKGQISPNESTMQIILLPRWYETLFFRILGIIILVSMLTGSIQFVLKRKKKNEKARLMADIQISDVKLESLRAQMNPHFVFNAMGSIQNLIQNDQKDLADTYLSRFSRLLRLYLESSKNEDILLKDEIQLITKYLEIEKLRFKDRLDFKIMVQPSELDTSTVKIPSLLLQPIIENALGHGLFHKEGGGLIFILIEEKAEGLKIIIEDDGIGRAKAAQMKTQTSNSHISRGLEMMKDRISLVNKKGNYRVSLEYHDLIKDTIPLGTRVILNIK